ncbi:hypothetical protein An09g03910 [Aspergillus niger]|uniref:Uncharacterized protein n=2 Tax=Aspergillus niger TaxID=5061 RepID=A2QU05_ASPNC|nr:hypothetical protein An09g03910 [Aspergillus niger]CAK96833.1 hypothetical protein An09g03910 [Aspergillus niger]
MRNSLTLNTRDYHAENTLHCVHHCPSPSFPTTSSTFSSAPLSIFPSSLLFRQGTCSLTSFLNTNCRYDHIIYLSPTSEPRPGLRSSLIIWHPGLLSNYQTGFEQPDKHQEAAKYALIVYRLSDFSDDIKWKISFSTIEEQHVFLRLLHLDDTNEEYKRLASKKEKARNKRSLLRSGTTPLSEKITSPAVQNKEKLTGSGESNTKPQQFKDPQQKSADAKIENKNSSP